MDSLGTASAERLRAVFGRFATGVAVMTTMDACARPVGVTANSFTSLSLDPPLVLWCLRLLSGSLRAFTSADFFAVNVLSVEQEQLARRFAAPIGDRFAAVSWHGHSQGPPVLSGAVATLVCRRVQEIHGGDHVIVIGRVEDFDMTSSPPLVFLDGHYQTPVLAPG